MGQLVRLGADTTQQHTGGTGALHGCRARMTQSGLVSTNGWMGCSPLGSLTVLNVPERLHGSSGIWNQPEGRAR